ncbi:MAG: hypothetical protein B7Y25_04640 [Alphaproteobacteria bacterium 16-39-46]|nr:MAG: hypothetical protein B7Y25_04640 [Alphaproteobacteria bacterium 16-39-46]OZA42943.1 MAG: hypothetical protein B7X84_04465 [Alphaproteobacteria bacterium 17-39-52]HQS84204.1 hypothetical protein [Alphaproteobacteria bacterium]
MYMKFCISNFFIGVLVGMFISSSVFTMEDDFYVNTRVFASYPLDAFSPSQRKISVYVDTLKGEIKGYRLKEGKQEYMIYLPLAENLSLAFIPPCYRPYVLKAIDEKLIAVDDEKSINAVFTLACFRAEITRASIKFCLKNSEWDKKLTMRSVAEIICSYFEKEKTEEATISLPPCQIDQFTFRAFLNLDWSINHYKVTDKGRNIRFTLYYPLPENLSLLAVDPLLRGQVTSIIEKGIIEATHEKAINVAASLLRSGAEVNSETIMQALRAGDISDVSPSTRSILALILKGGPKDKSSQTTNTLVELSDSLNKCIKL